MKVQIEYLTLNIPSKAAFVSITPQVRNTVAKSANIPSWSSIRMPKF